MKKIILILFLIGIFPIFIISILNYYKTVSLMQTTIIEHLTANKNEKIRDLNNYLLHMDEYLKSISLKPSLQSTISNVIKTYETGGNDSQEYKESFLILNKFTTRLFEVHTIYDMFIINLEGDIVSSMRKEDDLFTNLIRGKYKDTELSKIFRDAISVDKQIISDFSYYGPSAIPSAFMAQPLFDNGVKIGALAIQIDTHYIYKIFNHYDGLGNTSETILAKQIENKALFINPLRYNQDTAFKYFVKIGSENGRPIQEAVQGQSGSGTFIDYQKNEVLASWDYIPLLRMGIVVKQDTKEAYQPIETIKNWALLIGFIVLLIILFLIIYISKSMKKIGEQKEQYEYAINSTSDGLWDWDIIKGTVFYSSRWKEMLGYSDDEPLNDFKGWEEKVHPDDIDGVRKKIEICQNNPNIEFKIINRLRHKDGSWIWVLCRGQIIFNENGKAIRMVGFNTDITEQRYSNELLKNTNKLIENKKKELETIIREAPNPIMLHNEDGKVLLVNKVWEELTGYEHKEIDTIEKWTSLAYGKRMPIIKEYINKLYELKVKSDEGQYDIITKDGKVITWKFSSAPLGIINDKRTVISSAMDITELKQKEELMIAQSRQAAMGEMIGMIAHQWRQPLQIINMNVNNTLTDIDFEEITTKKLQEYSELILTQTEHLTKTIDDFKNFFSPNKEKEDIPILLAIEEANSIIGASLISSSIVLNIYCSSDIKASIYKRELIQIILNFINNSKHAIVKNNIENGHIDIEVSEEANWIILKVSDNGGGIENDIIGKIFDPYFTTKDAISGTGLGLHISKTIIEKHFNGTIKAYNIDGGVSFEIKFQK